MENVDKSKWPGLGLPYGMQDIESGRLDWLLEQSKLLNELGFVPMVELKGDILTDEFVEDIYQKFKPFGGKITWHWSVGSTKKLGNPEEPVTEKLLKMATRAKELKEKFNLQAVTIHLAPAVLEEPVTNDWTRYASQITAHDMLQHINGQILAIRLLNKLSGGILHIENVDANNFIGGTKLPTYNMMQTGSYLDLKWLKDVADVNCTFDIEHFECAMNLLLKKRDMAILVGTPEMKDFTDEEKEFSEISGYLVREGFVPTATFRLDYSSFMRIIKPRLLHFGAATQAFNTDNEITTHLPYNANDVGQMGILDDQLNWLKQNPTCLGAIIEVTGDLYMDDLKNPGHNAYSPWSPRIKDDEEAKRSSFCTVMNRIKMLQN